MRTETQNVRPAPLAAMLDIAGRDVLVVGGGAVAARRAATLLEAGARVRVVAPVIVPELAALHAAGGVCWEARGVVATDPAGALLVVLASDDPAANAAAAAAARAAGVLVNDAEQPERGDLQVPAVVRRGRVQVAISTGGGSPALAAFLRRHLEAILPEEIAALADLAVRLREQGRAAGLDAAERERVATELLPRLWALLGEGRAAEAAALVDAAPARAGA